MTKPDPDKMYPGQEFKWWVRDWCVTSIRIKRHEKKEFRRLSRSNNKRVCRNELHMYLFNNISDVRPKP